MPLLENFVAAELLAPDREGDVAPAVAVIKVNFEGDLAKSLSGLALIGLLVSGVKTIDCAALAWHDRFSLPEMTPLCRRRLDSQYQLRVLGTVFLAASYAGPY